MAEVSLLTLDSGDIHERADVGRQLSRVGTPDQIPRLLKAAAEDKSPGVRLYCIGAAADILSRYRVGPRAAEISQDTRKELLAVVRAIDPAQNAGMFSVLATIEQPKAVRPILVGLRDPRLDVRTGAAVGMFRYCVSIAAAEDAATRAEGIALLNDPKVRPDIRAHLARLCAYCGWFEARPQLESLVKRDDQVAEAAAQALAWMRQLEDDQTLEGIWWSTGVDAGEIEPAPGPRQWLLLSGEQAATGAADALRAVKWARSKGGLKIGSKSWGLRRMILAPPGRGEERALAFQANGRTWYRAVGADAIELADHIVERGFGDLPEETASAMADHLVLAQPEGLVGLVTAARLELLAGQSAAAVARLEAALAEKKPKPELHFWLGEAYAAAGDQEQARASWERFAKRGPKRSALQSLARERLEGQEEAGERLEGQEE